MHEFDAISLFCEDIREEKSGTHSIVGVMGDNILLSSVPGALPKLGIYVRINLPLNFEVMPFEVFIRDPSGVNLHINTIDESLVLQSIQQAKDAGLLVAGIYSHMIATPFAIPQGGRFSVTLAGNFGVKLLSSLNITCPENSSAVPET